MSGVPSSITTEPKLGSIEPNLGSVELLAPLADALFGRARRSVLALLVSRPDQAFYYRQMARLLHLGMGALHRELRGLAEAGILLREAHGQQVYYRVNTACPIYADLQGLLLKTTGLGDVLQAVTLGQLPAEGRLARAGEANNIDAPHRWNTWRCSVFGSVHDASCGIRSRERDCSRTASHVQTTAG